MVVEPLETAPTALSPWLTAAGLLVGFATACGPSSGEPAAGTGGTAGAGGSMPTDCTVTVTRSELSPYIATVGIVSFTSSWQNPTSAEIHFGPDTDYGLVAPVDLTEDGYRTLLLGMTQNRTV